MKKVKEVIEILERFPPDTYCYAYEGEVTGIVIVSSTEEQLCIIHTDSSQSLYNESKN